MNELLLNSMFFGSFLSLGVYLAAARLRQRFPSPLLNPLMLSIIVIIAILKLTGIEYEHYDRGAKYLTYFITPATICLAIPLYRQFHHLKKNYRAILLAILSGVLSGLICIFGLAYVMSFSKEHYVTFLPKSITTAIGIDLSKELGGNSTITVTAIVLTGIMGSVMGEWICKVFKIKHPISVGLALGTASHVLGTSKALEIGEIEGAMSSLSVAISGIMTIVFAGLFARLM
ncbi:LrgB family protein [Clostridiales bacterium COT073_COT-073]|nr:LrgB family protein [Clostridiales bacterium COT073_COT-073]